MDAVKERRARTLPPPPPNRGPLLTPEQVAAHPELFNGIKGEGAKARTWVLKHVKALPNGERIKVKLGHSTVAYYLEDVREWIAARKTQ